MKRAIATGAAILLAAAGALAAAPGARADGIAGYGLNALAVAVRYQLNSPGFLPTGDPAEGNVMEFDVPIARTAISQGPLINALASPLYPGDTAAHLGTAIATFVPQLPKLPNYPIVAESNYPPTPDKGASTSFSQNGLGEGTSQTTANGAKVVARTVSQSIPGLLEIGAATATNDLTIAGDKVVSSATSSAGAITIAGMITIDQVIGRVNAVSDGVTGKPSAMLQIGRVTVAGQAGYIDRDGVHIATSPVLGAGLVAGLQSMVNAALATDGLTVRTIAPRTSVDQAAASAQAGALAITIDRTLPALGVPGVPSLNIPGVPEQALGTPTLPTHIDVLLGEASVGVNATSVPTFGIDLSPPIPVASGDTTVSAADFTSISGPGASLNGALTTPGQEGQGELSLQPASERGTGRGIPVGWVIVGILGAFVISGPLLGYARWQLLEGRHR